MVRPEKWNSETSRTERLKALLIRCGHRLNTAPSEAQTQGKILRILYLHGDMPQKELQEQLGIQPGSMSEIVLKLVRKGMVVREKSAGDRRMFVLKLTEAGCKDVEDYHSSRNFRRPQLFNALSEEERKTLESLLEKLLESWNHEEQR